MHGAPSLPKQKQVIHRMCPVRYIISIIPLRSVKLTGLSYLRRMQYLNEFAPCSSQHPPSWKLQTSLKLHISNLPFPMMLDYYPGNKHDWVCLFPETMRKMWTACRVTPRGQGSRWALWHCGRVWSLFSSVCFSLMAWEASGLLRTSILSKVNRIQEGPRAPDHTSVSIRHSTSSCDLLCRV